MKKTPRNTFTSLLITFSIITSSLSALAFYPDELTAHAQRPTENIEKSPPVVQITSPVFCNDQLIFGDITITGIAHDEQSGIEKVEAFIHPLPFNNEFPFQPVEPTSVGNWSEWSFHAYIPDDGKTYRILVRAVDHAGNANWDETFVNSESIRDIHEARELLMSDAQEQPVKRIALVTPTFTSAAYNYDSFYFFYYRYASVPEGVAITKDLNLMTGELPLEFEDAAILDSFASRIKAFSPESIVSIIKDENVHHGLIFAEDGRNVYDTLFLFHNEYVTQEEYDNLRQFVNNGGEIVFIDPNIFYAEVKYDESSCMVTLVKGHNWEFDGTAVRKGVWERYLEENKDWMGSNFINRDISNPVRFDNNPFNYAHFEENELVNPNAKVLIDYGAKFKIEQPKYPLIIGGILKQDEYSDLGMRVASYELQYGKGKVIMLGIYGQNLVNNTAFVNFFERIILPRAIGVEHNVNVDGEMFELYSKLQDGKVSQVMLDKDSKSLTLTLDMEQNRQTKEDVLTITIPKRLIDASKTGTDLADFTILVDGKEVGYLQSYDDIERSITLTVQGNSKEIKILGTQVAPEFNFSLLMLGILALPIMIRTLGRKLRAER